MEAGEQVVEGRPAHLVSKMTTEKPGQLHPRGATEGPDQQGQDAPREKHKYDQSGCSDEIKSLTLNVVKIPKQEATVLPFQEAQQQGQGPEQGTYDSSRVSGAVAAVPDGPQD